MQRDFPIDAKHPTTRGNLPILVGDPRVVLVWVSAESPRPEFPEDMHIHLLEHSLRNDGGVIVAPPTYDRVQESD
jgi:hypothetical protein